MEALTLCWVPSCRPVCHLQSSVYGVLSKSHVPRAWSAKGGKFHLKLNIGLRPIANKYQEGKVKRTLKRKLKVLESAEREANGTSSAGRDCRMPRPCAGRMRCFCLVCQLRSEVGENSGDMDAIVRGGECAWQDPSLDCEQCFGMFAVLTKCFYSTRLGTRTEESNMCASSRVSNLLAQ